MDVFLGNLTAMLTQRATALTQELCMRLDVPIAKGARWLNILEPVALALIRE